ncbi:MAG: PAS domain-containing protein, partial [Vulcanimicrobiaceae bacterium]
MSDSISPDASALQPSLSLVLERITDGFFAVDSSWRITYMNAEARKLLKSQDGAIGRLWLEAFPKARGSLFEREYQRAMNEQMPVQFTEYSETAACWFEVKAYPSPDGFSVYFRDVSSHIEAQREIERNVRRQQALIDFGRAALGGRPFAELVADALELLRDIVETPVVEIFDFERSRRSFTVRAALGWSTGAALDPQIPMLDHVSTALSSDEAFVCSDVRIEPRARSLAMLASRDVLSCIAVAIGTSHEPVGAIAVYARSARTFAAGDVRFVESIAQALAEASTAAESNGRMAQVLESIRDAFVAVDRDLRITYVNARMAMFWGAGASEMIGVPISRFTDDFNDDGRALECFRSALANDRASSFETLYGTRWFEVRLYPFSNGVAGYVQDITSRKNEQQRVLGLNAELERRVAERTYQLQLANKELESFSYSVSHDLRAPLRAIDGFSQALVEDYEDRFDERGKNYLDRVRRAAQRMAGLIDALLKLARVARADITCVTVDLSPIAQSIVSELR